MPLPTGDVIGILADNLRLRKSVLPLPTKVATKWTEGLDLPRGGETVLYTGMMYQLIPYIEGLVKAEMKFGDSWLAKYTGLGRKVNRIVNISAFMARPSAQERALYNQVPIDVVHLLRKAGVQFGALYEDDLYSGALAYDLGADEVLAQHAQRVQAVFKKHGVQERDHDRPAHHDHATQRLSQGTRRLRRRGAQLPRGAGREGMTPSTTLSGEVVVHDSCVFARYEGIVDEPRELLAAAGLTVCDPENSGRQTWCCGGPVESLYPAKAAANAQKRVAQLRAAAPDAVTMCPMCFVNLSGAAGETMRFKDISQYLREAYAS